MNIKYITKDLKDIKITPDIEKLAEKKLTQGLKKYINKNQEQNVTVRISDKKPRIRVDVETMYLNFHIQAEAEVTINEGIVGGIEKCIDILDRQISKYRTKIHRSVHKNRGANKTEFAEFGAGEFDDSDGPDGSDDSGENGRRIIKVENYEPKPMNVEEAALQLEVLDYKFLFFYNTETDSPGVVYKRDDGNIGLIEG